MMKRCKDHYFHLECLEGQLGKNEHLDCSVCMVTYGIKTGDQPPGSMTWEKDTHVHCDGFSREATWIINYSFPSGKHPETKKRFGGDSR